MEFDLLIRGGQIVDGSGKPMFRGDVGVLGDRIAAVGILDGATAPETISASERLVCPGFIDTHVHSEVALRGSIDRFGSVLQGVTTHLTGADGFGWAGLSASDRREMQRSSVFAYGDSVVTTASSTVDAYLAGFRGSTPVNIVPMVPHQALRFAVLGWRTRAATEPETGRMGDLMRAWMDAGAVGLNTGLDYAPAAAATPTELTTLARIARTYDGVLAAHVRYAALGRGPACEEIIGIGREAGVPVRISHEWVDDTTEPMLDAAQHDGDVAIDWYLYPAGSSHLMIMLPVTDKRGGPDGLRRRLKRDRRYRERIAAHFQDRLQTATANGETQYVSDTRTGRWIGQSIADIAASMQTTIGRAAVHLIIEEAPHDLLVFRQGLTEQAFIERASRTIRHPAFTVASDGIYHGALPHPRGYGCFARVLRLFVRELKALSVEAAIRKMSALPAERFGIRDRGVLAVGKRADLVVFDPESVADRATWAAPRLGAAGVDAVIVNGRIVVREGAPTGELPGRVIARASP